MASSAGIADVGAQAVAYAELVPLGVLHHRPDITVLGHWLRDPPTAEGFDPRARLIHVVNVHVEVQPVLRRLRLGHALEPQKWNAGEGEEVDVVRPVADGRLNPGPEHGSPEARKL